MDGGKFFEGFVIGALIGAAVALFMAPQSGKQTQETISGRVNMVLDEGKRAAADRRAELEAQLAQSRSTPRPVA
ncbi:MAG: YtxH domain-containing protein [Anaerolineae bacterium]|jgi:gas vesicle protein|nr:YtxH domain-containing protein [Anaerolineae bacterium]